MIDVNKTLTGNDGFVQVPNIIFTMYPLLDGFSIETAGLYAYLCNWKQNDPEHNLYNCVWLTKEDIMAQAGIGRTKLDRNLKVLEWHKLIKVHSVKNSTRKIYEIFEPITEAEFRVQYSKEVAILESKMRELQRKLEIDREQLEGKRIAWKVSQITVNADFKQ